MGKKRRPPPSQQEPTPPPSMDDLLNALESELEKPLPPSPLLDTLEMTEEGMFPEEHAQPHHHIPERRRDEGLGLAEKQMIGRMWHQITDKFADEEDKT
ncbi:MAG: hypothetical protein G8345_11470 [Magnetococcales bacterium]|nr:hypothetical protein [Magnetococcales bacterium]NGZ27493.1 hypothetical protein [Magnetococcales bacterium]